MNDSPKTKHRMTDPKKKNHTMNVLDQLKKVFDFEILEGKTKY